MGTPFMRPAVTFDGMFRIAWLDARRFGRPM